MIIPFYDAGPGNKRALGWLFRKFNMEAFSGWLLSWMERGKQQSYMLAFDAYPQLRSS